LLRVPLFYAWIMPLTANLEVNFARNLGCDPVQLKNTVMGRENFRSNTSYLQFI